ncbi:MAG: hypothetical protein RIQ54_594 [Candidatus Parcubacteria bacterium]|jgi:uncharacterized protein YpmB
MKQHTTMIGVIVVVALLAIGVYYWITMQPFTAKAPQNQEQVDSGSLQKQAVSENADISAELDAIDVGDSIEADIKKTDSDVNQL